MQNTKRSKETTLRKTRWLEIKASKGNIPLAHHIKKRDEKISNLSFCKYKSKVAIVSTRRDELNSL